MSTYVIRRLLLLPVTVLLLSIFVFSMIRLVPGSVVDQRLSTSATPADRARLESYFGLDKPAPEQYIRWLSRIVRGDLGDSWLDNQSIAESIQSRMPITLELLALTMLMYIPIGTVAGVFSALRRGRPEDLFVRLLSILFVAIPSFWLATLVIILPLTWWQYSPPLPYARLGDEPLRNLQLMLPAAATTALGTSALLARVIRSEMLEVLHQDYVRTARAKGLAPRAVNLRHALRNTLPPIVTIVGLAFAGGIAGTVVIEQIFTIPGMGSYIVDALQTNDLPVVQAWMVIFGTIFILVNLLVDLSYAWLDPRIRLR